MIRQLKKEDVDEVLRIWLFASLITHNQIEQHYWLGQLHGIRNEYIPKNETYVHERNDTHCITGFYSLDGNDLKALGIAPGYIGKGFGKALVDHAKSLREDIELSLFEDNMVFLAFFQKQQFRITGEQFNPIVQCKEIILRYSKE